MQPNWIPSYQQAACLIQQKEQLATGNHTCCFQQDRTVTIFTTSITKHKYITQLCLSWVTPRQNFIKPCKLFQEVPTFQRSRTTASSLFHTYKPHGKHNGLQLGALVRKTPRHRRSEDKTFDLRFIQAIIHMHACLNTDRH